MTRPAFDDVQDLAEAVRISDALGPVVLDLDTGMAISLIAVLQLASRHPAAMGSHSIQEAQRFARALQDHLAARDERLGRYLERGWHTVFDESTPYPPFRKPHHG